MLKYGFEFLLKVPEPYVALLVFIGVSVSFLLLYLVFSLATWFITHKLLGPKEIGGFVDSRELRKGQIRFEIKNSMLSILIFGVYGVVNFEAIKHGIFEINLDSSATQVVLELIALFIWNEIHFFICHLLLHTRFLLKRVHKVHHWSVTPTPFSIYSFHWFEATLLGSVFILALPFHVFSIEALLLLPVLSIFFNVVGHSNYELQQIPATEKWYTGGRGHALHHKRSKGNYGFFLPILDRVFNTELEED